MEVLVVCVVTVHTPTSIRDGTEKTQIVLAKMTGGKGAGNRPKVLSMRKEQVAAISEKAARIDEKGVRQV